MSATSMDTKLAVLEAHLGAMNLNWQRHTEQDMVQFNELKAMIVKMDENLNALVVREAKKDGEASGIKRSVVVIAGGISLAISCLGVVLSVFNVFG